MGPGWPRVVIHDLEASPAAEETLYGVGDFFGGLVRILGNVEEVLHRFQHV